MAAPLPADSAPVRVLHVITSLDRGGAENHVLALISHGDTRAFHVEAAVLRGEGELEPRFRELGVDVHRLGATSRFDIQALQRLTTLLRQRAFDIVHSHLFRADIYAAAAVASLGSRGPLLISTRHNDDRFFLNPFVGVAHYVVSGQQDLIIAISDHIAHFTIQRGVQHPSRVRRVYHGLDVPDIHDRQRERARVRRELGVGDDDFLVGNVGRLAPQKGQRHLIGAMPLLLEQVPNAHAIIAGGGDLEDYLRELADELGVAERAHVLGPRPDVPRLMHALDAFAMPSIWEGFGLVLLEAMAAGLPIVASRVATIPEVVLDGETGLLVPAGDAVALASALARLASDPGLARQLGEAGRRRLQAQFSIEKMVGDTELLYRELVDERLRSRSSAGSAPRRAPSEPGPAHS